MTGGRKTEVGEKAEVDGLESRENSGARATSNDYNK